MSPEARHATIIGSGPNGLAAAITLAEAGCSVQVIEGERLPGGGARSAELTLPGFLHDLCSAIYPLGAGSPFFRRLPLSRFGLEWIVPEVAVAHPFDDGTAVLLSRSVEETARGLGRDRAAYRRLMEPFVGRWEALLADLLGPPRLPRRPLLLARFGPLALRSAASLARSLFREERARGLFAGIAAHSVQPLEFLATSAFGLLLGLLGHAVGWPVARGGAQKITDALIAYLRSLGGELVTDRRVESIDTLAPSRWVLCDVTPRQLLGMAGDRFPDAYRRRLEQYRYGPGAFKIDWAVDGPIPWTAPGCQRTACVHVGGTLEEIEAAERAAWNGEHPERPFVLVGQPCVVDPTRAPARKHTVWAYCHVPHGSTVDMTEQIEAQMERFAPGFRSRILARHLLPPGRLQQHNPNLIGGDISGGANDLRQLIARPTLSLSPYATPARGIYLCSSSTPPGGGVHGMCGYHAARAALGEEGRG